MKEKDKDLNTVSGVEEDLGAAKNTDTTEPIAQTSQERKSRKKESKNDVSVERGPKSKGGKIALKIANIVINTLIVIVLLLSILIATLALSSKANDGVPSIFGFSFHTIMSDSMKGGSKQYEGGNFERGDLVIGKPTKGNINEVYEVGDIVVFTTQNDNTPDGVEFIAHRIIEREDRNGTYYYTTKGDNNAIEDTDQHSAADIVALIYDHDYNGAVWKGFGNVLNYIRSSEGFFLVVLLPMIIFFLYEIIRVVMNALNYKKSKAQEDKEDAEREKQEAVDAAVKAALAAVGKEDESARQSAPADPVDADSVKDAAPEMSAEDMEEFKQFLAFKQAQKEKTADAPEEE